VRIDLANLEKIPSETGRLPPVQCIDGHSFTTPSAGERRIVGAGLNAGCRFAAARTARSWASACRQEANVRAQMLAQETRSLACFSLPRIQNHRRRTTQKIHQLEKLFTDRVALLGAFGFRKAFDQPELA